MLNLLVLTPAVHTLSTTSKILPPPWNGDAFNGGGGTEYDAEVIRRKIQHRADDYELWRGDSRREKCVGGGEEEKEDAVT